MEPNLLALIAKPAMPANVGNVSDNMFDTFEQ